MPLVTASGSAHAHGLRIVTVGGGPRRGGDRALALAGRGLRRHNSLRMLLADAVLTAYFTVLLLLALYGSHRFRLLFGLARHGAAAAAAAERLRARGAPLLERDPPPVLVQLPVFNERYVVERLIRAVAALDYPKSRLAVQILDDSTDDTGAIADRVAAECAAAGLEIRRLHRQDRRGFKAGALAAGLQASEAPFVAIFDADFVPKPDFLRATLPCLLADERTGLVQARWEHLNRDDSILTGVQAVLLDGHFIAEHGARHAMGCFFNFNGTAGVWRRSAIRDAGGWAGDTLTEDLDLSYRAQLRGWRFVFLPEVAAPAELPVSMGAFKAQQRRWAKGSFQTARKLLPQVLASPLPIRVRVEAFFHLSANLAYPLMSLLSLLMVPALFVRVDTGLREMALLDIPIFVAATISVVSFYAVSEHRVFHLAPEAGRGRLLRRLRHLPVSLAVGIGLSFSNAAAVLGGVMGRRTPFVRTPKYGIVRSDRGESRPWIRKSYRAHEGAILFLELTVGAVMAAATLYAILEGVIASAPFLLLFAVGYLYVGGRSLAESRRRAAPGSAAVRSGISG